MRTYRGSCHCRAVRFEIDTELSEFTMCDCSMCRRRNAVMIKVHESDFRLIAGDADLATYQWNTRTAKHHFCTRCGIYTFHRKRLAPDHYGVNVHCLEDADIEGVPITRLDGVSLSVEPVD